MKVLICHYRVGRTDGVSLEIEKRKTVLSRLGHQVLLLSGPISEGADYIIDELEFDADEIRLIKRNAFGRLADFPTGRDLLERVCAIAARIKQKAGRIIEGESPDFLLLHNIFSHGRNIAAAKAFYELIEERRLPALATHHDFYWERPQYEKISCAEITAYLHRYLPPRSSLITHAVISNPAQAELRQRTGLRSVVTADSFDFKQERWTIDRFNRGLPAEFDLRDDDLFFLQATRIVERKGIELALELLAELNKGQYRRHWQGARLYNGKRTGPSSRVVLVLAGYAEKDSLDYLERLKARAQALGVEVRPIAHRIGAARQERDGGKTFSLWDVYPFADIVTYPSLQEGWGNQFIEAVFAEKPIVVFEYPVFQSDIKPAGYWTLSLGSRAFRNPTTGLWQLKPERLQETARALTEALLQEDTCAKLKVNFELGKKHHSLEALQTRLKEILPQ